MTQQTNKFCYDAFFILGSVQYIQYEYSNYLEIVWLDLMFP